MKMKLKTVAWGFILVLSSFWSCAPETEKSQYMQAVRQSLFESVPPDSSNVLFENRVESSFDFNILEYNYFYNGSGVAVGDLNNDDLPDLVFGGNQVSSRIYLNQGNLQFQDVSGSADFTTASWITGVSIIDIDQNGWNDIYLCVAGDPDPQKRKNLLYLNQGDGTFREEGASYGLADTGYSTQAAWFDYDLDGDVDLYLLTHDHDKSNPNLPRPKKTGLEAAGRDRLYRNEGIQSGRPKFVEAGLAAGIVHEGYGLGMAIDDFNRDGWPDIYVANDFAYDDLLYLNNGDGTFTESAGEFLKHTSRFSMGTDAADLNNDGWPDLVTLDMLPDDNLRQKQMNIAMNYDRHLLFLERGYLPQFSRNMLQLNNGTLNNRLIPFSEIGQLAGIHETDWSWSALLADFDNDGRKDLVVTNGIPKDITDSDFIHYRDSRIYGGNFDYNQLKKVLLEKLDSLPEVNKPNFAFRNLDNLGFQDVSNLWGLDDPSCSNGAAYADLDLDGDLDLVMNNLNGRAFLYRNKSADRSEGNFLRLKLTGPSLNPHGIGARVQVKHGENQQTWFLNPARGFQSMTEPVVHFGLGEDTVAAEIRVVWPDRKEQVLQDIAVNQVLKVDYRQASLPGKSDFDDLPADGLFRQVNQKLHIDHKHRENEFSDFKLEPLLPHKFSRNGPGMAVADVNADGLEDFWIGGAHLQPGTIYLQQKDRTFRPVILPDEKFEDLGGLFFDADNDGDPDLYVVSGGSEFNAHTAAYQDRFYRNDGKGNFGREENVLPEVNASGSCVVAADYDRDGDLDLFVGGRITPARYPQPAGSYLLRNENGRQFRDVTSELAPELEEAGLVTSALWTDFNADFQPDLILTGEWMPLTFLQNEGGRFRNVTAEVGMEQTHGWWNSLISLDYDLDGDLDYVAGNLGLNTLLKAQPENPLTMVANDFDRNGSIDAVIGRFHRGKLVPLAARDALVDQMSFMRKRFPTYLSYASAGFDQVILPAEQERSYRKKVEILTTSLVENHGNGKFSLRTLPKEAQMAPVYGMLAADFNQDGNPDLLLQGNSYSAEFVNGQYDAFRGLLLEGDGSGNFTPVSNRKHGMVLDHDGKSMVRLQAGPEMAILTGANNGSLSAFGYSVGEMTFEPGNEDYYILVNYRNGKKQKIELSYGSGYLSQSSRQVILSRDIVNLEVYSSDQKKKIIDIQQ